MATLTMEQCHKLIHEAYSQIGGMNFTKALTKVGPNELPLEDSTFLGVNVEGVGLCQHHRRMCAVKIVPCISTTKMFKTIVLNRDVISVAIDHRADVYGDESRYEPSNY